MAVSNTSLMCTSLYTNCTQLQNLKRTKCSLFIIAYLIIHQEVYNYTISKDRTTEPPLENLHRNKELTKSIYYMTILGVNANTYTVQVCSLL